MDLSVISIPDLKILLNEIPKEIARREKSEKARIRKEIEEMAARAGFSLDELLGENEGTAKVKKAVAAKYRHPQDGSLEWTGRGRQPRWIVEFLNAGGTLEQLVI